MQNKENSPLHMKIYILPIYMLTYFQILMIKEITPFSDFINKWMLIKYFNDNQTRNQ